MSEPETLEHYLNNEERNKAFKRQMSELSKEAIEAAHEWYNVEIPNQDTLSDCIQSAIDKATERELLRWQELIRDELVNLSGTDKIDGAGCDSGDPLDFTIAEIRQAFDKATERVIGVVKREIDNCDNPSCEADRADLGFSNCAGGHIARRVVKAIEAMK